MARTVAAPQAAERRRYLDPTARVEVVVAPAPPRPPAEPKGWRRYRVVLHVLVGLALLDWLVASHAGLWGSYSPDDYAERVRACQQLAPDLVVLGGSPVTEGFNTGLLKGATWGGQTIERAYNLGLPGGTTSEVWHAAKHGVPHRPKLVVYGITASDVNDARFEPHGPYALMSWGDWRQWVAERPKSSEWVTRHFVQGRLSRAWQLYRHRNGIRLWLADRAEDDWPGSFPDSAAEARRNRDYAAGLRRDDGYAPNAGFVDRHYSDFKAIGGRPGPFHFLEGFRTGDHLRCLDKMLDHFSRQGVPVVLVDMPVTEDLERSYAPAFEQYRAALTAIERDRGVTVLRATREAVGLSDRQFADQIHLNYDGAVRLTRWVRSNLEAIDSGVVAP